jgi:hypothetical protein
MLLSDDPYWYLLSVTVRDRRTELLLAEEDPEAAVKNCPMLWVRITRFRLVEPIVDCLIVFRDTPETLRA